MKVNQIINEGIFDVARNVVEQAGKELYGSAYAFDTERSFRTWTRGDHVQYKDWNTISPTRIAIKGEGGTEEGDATSQRRAIERLWEYLQALPRAKALEIKGEFGSSPFSEALKVGDVVYIKGSYQIEFGSRNRLKNIDVWKSR